MTPDPQACRGDAGQADEPDPPSVRLSFQDLLEAFEFADVGGLGENEAFVCRRTGAILLRSDYLDQDEVGQLPEDIEDGAKYLALPDKRELGLGKPLALAFARELLPDDFDDVRYMFSRRGAYANFKALLVRRNARERWYECEAEATAEALREWCEINAIELTD